MDLSGSPFALSLSTETGGFWIAIEQLNIGIKGFDSTAIYQNNNALYSYQNISIHRIHIGIGGCAYPVTTSCYLWQQLFP